MQKKVKILSMVGREIQVAVKAGGPDRRKRQAA